MVSNYLKNPIDSLDYSVWKNFDYQQKILYLINKKPWKIPPYSELFLSYKENPVDFRVDGTLQL
jgi:hypothetical protein